MKYKIEEDYILIECENGHYCELGEIILDRDALRCIWCGIIVGYVWDLPEKYKKILKEEEEL